MSGVNKVILLGRLGTDPEVKTVGAGRTVARLNLATSENWTDKDGNRQERTEWHRVDVWGKQAELCGQYLSKGRMVYVEGKLQTRSWEDQQGQKRYATDIVASTIQFVGGNSQQRDDSKSMANTMGGGRSASGFDDFGPDSSVSGFDVNEEIPF